MGNESCCAPTKNTLGLGDQPMSSKLARQGRDPFANLEGYIPDEDVDQDLADTYKNSRNSSDPADAHSAHRRMGSPGRPLLCDVTGTDGEASYVSKEERIAA